jgi:hypothetical protein
MPRELRGRSKTRAAREKIILIFAVLLLIKLTQLKRFSRAKYHLIGVTPQTHRTRSRYHGKHLVDFFFSSPLDDLARGNDTRIKK